MVKPLPAIAGDTRDEGLIPGLGRSRRGGYGNPLQYSCLKNYMDIGAWKAKVHWDAKELDTAEATERSIQHLRIIFGKHFLYKTSSVESWLFCLRKGADLLTLHVAQRVFSVDFCVCVTLYNMDKGAVTPSSSGPGTGQEDHIVYCIIYS